MGHVGAPGQRIPAIIGIGELVKGVYIWWSRDDGVEEVDDGVGKELRGCVEVYQRPRKEREDLAKEEEIASTAAAEV